MRSILPISVFLMLASIVWAAEANSPSGAGSGQEGGSFGASALRSSSGHVSTLRDTAEITYPDQTSASAPSGTVSGSQSQARRLLMIEPERYDEEGICIWRDPEGVWNIRPVSRKGFSITADISAEIGIEAFGDQAAAIKASAPSKIHIAQPPLKGTSTVYQFKATGAYIDLDLLIDGKREPGHIYLGRQSWNPHSIPFRLENRPLVVEQERPGQAVTTGLSVYPSPRSNARSGNEGVSPPMGSASSGGGGVSDHQQKQ